MAHRTGATEAAASTMPAVATVSAATIPLDRFNAEDRHQVLQIASGVEAADSQGLALFGAAPQRKLGDFLDQLLQGLTGEDIGLAGQLVAGLASEIKSLNLGEVQREVQGGLPVLARLPLVGRHFSAWRRFHAMHQTVAAQLGKIERRAETHLVRLKVGIGDLDRLLAAVEENLGDLELWIAGGQQALLRLRAELTHDLARPQRDRDAVRQAALRDRAEQLEAFDARLARMSIAFTRGILAIPQIRMAQQAARIEIQNTLDTVLFDLPDLKSAIVRVGALGQISRAAEATRARRALTRELQEIGVEALDRAYSMAKGSQGDVADDVASLSRVSERILGILDRGAGLDRENRARRAAALRQLAELRDGLADGLRIQAAQNPLA